MSLWDWVLYHKTLPETDENGSRRVSDTTLPLTTPLPLTTRSELATTTGNRYSVDEKSFRIGRLVVGMGQGVSSSFLVVLLCPLVTDRGLLL